MKKLHSGNKIIALSVNNLREKKEKEDCNVGNHHILGAIKREKSLVYYKNSTMKLHTTRIESDCGVFIQKIISYWYFCFYPSLKARFDFFVFKQGPLQIWTEHSPDLIFWKSHLGGRTLGPLGRTFWTITFYDLKKFRLRSI